jgi:hypothetical protein
MAAYAKVRLVTPVFHPSDIAFVRGWSRAAPGFGGWRVQLDDEDAPERVAVVPPGSEEARFVIRRDVRETVLARCPPAQGDELQEVGRFDSLREAVLALCPITDEALEDIHLDLERSFPRHGR